MKKPLFIRTLLGESVERPPVWLMRQAGRYLPEYREMRSQMSFLELVKSPKDAAEVTLQPIRRFGMDAAIVFCDILMIPEAMGQHLSFGKGMGPKLEPAIRSMNDVDRLVDVDSLKSCGYLAETIRILCQELPYESPLIGFAGAPFTVAAYMVEGQGSKNWAQTKELMLTQPNVFQTLLDRVVDNTIGYLKMQIEAGCQAIQLFDTWAGQVAPDELINFVLPAAQRVIEGVNALGAPTIYFPKGLGLNLRHMQTVPSNAYGVDWQSRMHDVVEVFPNSILQGNLDPSALYATRERLDQKIDALLTDAKKAKGFVANLGHGLLPTTPPEAVGHFVKRVQEFRY